MNKHRQVHKGVRIMWIALIVVGVLVAALIAGMMADAPARKEALELTFSSIDFTRLKDGTYVGEYRGTTSRLRDTMVEVMVANGAVSAVSIIKGAVDKDGKPLPLRQGKSIEDIFKTAIDQQTLQVDVISGATITSKTHLKALENALGKALQ